MPNKTWVIVAESSRAKIYELDKKNSPLVALKEFAAPSSTQTHAITTDIALNNDNSSTQDSHHFKYASPTKQDKGLTFARKISNHLDNACNNGQFDKLIIMSSPAFLGQLRKQLKQSTNRYIVSEIGKNLVRHDTQSIRAHIPFSY